MFTKTTNSSSVSMRMATTGKLCQHLDVQVVLSKCLTAHTIRNCHARSSACIIADMLQASKDFIVLEYIKMQEQSGASHCGLFAILGLPLHYAMGKIFVCSFFNAETRATVLPKCVLPFPSQSIAAQRPKVLKEEVVEIYCHVRLPYTGRWCNAMDARSGSIAILLACISRPRQEIMH